MKHIRTILALFLLGILLFQNSIVIVYATEAKKESKVPSGILYNDIPETIESYVEKHTETMAGMSVALYDGNGTIYQNDFGYADKENNILVDEQTVYDWGSTSKLLIWISVMQLVEQDKLDLQEDIRNYLPDGFLKNLSYDKAITMLDLMNHQAGFQETFFTQTADEKKVGSLEEALSSHQPKQIYEPGEVTAYSNWGAALAAFIVERVSKTDYVEYVHKNIFEPLGMEHTSIGATYQDHAWVKQQREKLVCYDALGEKLPGNGIYYIFIYPAGSATGTIYDLLTFAQAITPNENKSCPLFKNQKTLEQLYTATSFYGSSGVPNNYHGFFSSKYGVETLGHSGNTFGCSTMLQFDPDTGIGMVVMTNQAYETVYNYNMYKLIFGKFFDSELAKINRDIPQGFVMNTRSIKEGPFSIWSTMEFGEYSEEALSSWWYQDGNHIYNESSDYIIISPVEVTMDLLCYLLFILAGVYGVVTLIFGGLICSPIQKKLQRKKGVNITHPFRKWNYGICVIMSLILADNAVMYLRISIGSAIGEIGSVSSYMVQSGIIGILAVALIVSLVCAPIYWHKKQIADTKIEKAKYITTTVLAIGMLVTVILFDMYQFWAI
ncbi:MAG: serine hydrolase [Clostridia bacterium]|nr:serine hydrolase [Clostridia bacterium]